MDQDDIDFDEEELQGEREDNVKPVLGTDDDQDVEMSAADNLTSDQIGESSMRVDGVVDVPAQGVPGEAPPATKRRMIITHDKYMTLQSLVVLHLAETERETGRGIDRDELIDWYLELKESEIQDVEELEYEKELITKMLRKLVKVELNVFPAWRRAENTSFSG